MGGLWIFLFYEAVCFICLHGKDEKFTPKYPAGYTNGLNSRSISRRIQSHLVLKLIWQRQRRENCDAWQACLHNATSV